MLTTLFGQFPWCVLLFPFVFDQKGECSVIPRDPAKKRVRRPETEMKGAKYRNVPAHSAPLRHRCSQMAFQRCDHPLWQLWPLEWYFVAPYLKSKLGVCAAHAHLRPHLMQLLDSLLCVLYFLNTCALPSWGSWQQHELAMLVPENVFWEWHRVEGKYTWPKKILK